jgi:hypothetical protein
MGLKTVEKISPADVLRVATNLSSSTDTKRKDTATSLMTLLNRRSDLLTQNTGFPGTALSERLASLQWIPVHADRPHNYPTSLRYASHEITNGLAAPSEVRSYSQAYLIGSVRPLVNVKDVAQLANVFKWNTNPRVKDVADHLLNVVQCYRAEEKISVQYVTQQIYHFLNSNENYILEWLGIMNGNRWIWNDEGFGDVTQIVMRKDSIDLRPYRYNLPRAFEEFRLLWTKCELKERSDMTEVLRAIHEAYSQQQNRDLEVERDIQLSVNILNHLAKQNLEEQFA